MAQEAGRTGAGISAVKDTASAPVKAGKPRPAPAEVSRYRVKKGDTLGSIARRHQTSIAILMKLNGIKLRDPLLADRVLKIPAQFGGMEAEGKPVSNGKRPPAKKREPVMYRVRKGDTLEAIARRHGTTVRLLTELNHLKPAEPLFVDRKLILSGAPAL